MSAEITTKSADRKKWSLWRAALYGFIFSALLYAFHVFAVRDENLPGPSAAELGAITGLLSVGPIIFVMVALVRNLFVKKFN
jgi:hypothetical protein